jgi:hypothetical protein
MAHTTTTANPITRDKARITLGIARLVFGTLGLLAPRLLIRRIQGTGTNSPAAVYAFRMFGIRTVLIGQQILAPDGPNRREALRVAPIIHGADTATATILTIRSQVSKRTGLSLIAVSGFNTAMALLAMRRAQQQERPTK